MTGSSSWITTKRRAAVYCRDSYTCCYCSADVSGNARARGLDHLEDLVPGGGHRGGNHSNTNIVTVCAACNSARGAKPWREFAAKFPGAVERIEARRMAPVVVAMTAKQAAKQAA